MRHRSFRSHLSLDTLENSSEIKNEFLIFYPDAESPMGTQRHFPLDRYPSY